MDELVKRLRSLANDWRDRAWTTQDVKKREALRDAARELDDELTRRTE